MVDHTTVWPEAWHVLNLINLVDIFHLLTMELSRRPLCSEVVMDRITATTTAVNRMLAWQPQPQCGFEYHNRNHGYFIFNNRVYLKEIFIQEKIYFTYFEVWIVIMSSHLTIFFVIVQKRIYGSIYFSSLSYLNFFNTYYFY